MDPFQQQSVEESKAKQSDSVLDRKVVNDRASPTVNSHQTAFSKRIQLINNFNSVYAPTKKPVQILNELLELYPRSQLAPLLSTTSYDPITQTYRSTVRVENMASLTSTELTEEQSKLKAQMRAFYFLKDLSRLVVNFKSLHSANVSPLEVMEELMRQNSTMIKIQTIRERHTRFRTTIQIVNINSFVGSGSSELDSRDSAAFNTVEYFKDFAARIN